MIKFVIVNPYDFNLYMKPYSHPLRAISQLFYKIGSIQYMADHGIEVIPLPNFIEDIILKYELRDYNTCEKYYINYDTMDEKARKTFYACISKLMKDIYTTNNYNNSVIYGIQPMGFDPFLRDKIEVGFPISNYEILKSKNIKVIIYHDDLHGYPFIKNNRQMVDDHILLGTPINRSILQDIRCDRCDVLLSHAAPFFNHLKIYGNKTRLYFTPLDDIIYSMFTPETFYERKPKILLTGAIGGYPLRTAIYDQLNIKNPIAIKHYEWFDHPGKILELTSCKKGGLYSYYVKIAEYRAAVVGYYKKPLDHILYKTFEILATGTLLFSQETVHLQNIGMKKYIHYVPLTEASIVDNAHLSKFMNTNVGKQIAKNGYNFVKSYMDNKKNMDYFINIIKSFK